ncbi:sensor histidine kinase [Aquabacter cavernae]|uniref:sensor histidine kinase n=1 Tax=Aquabacter cavernae TaxID=2496029 RepID=UPI000F8CA89D|nr:histidine kinase [Aquabacter cavernae]
MPNATAAVPGQIAFGWKRLGFFWQTQLAGWSAFALVDFANRLLTYHDVKVALALTGIVWPFLLGLSTGLAWLYGRYLPRSRLNLRSFALVVALSVAAAALVMSVVFTVRFTTGWSIPGWHPLEEIGVPLIHYSFIILGWSICFFWIRAELGRRAAIQRVFATQAEAMKAEIQHLRLQLDPHFLFNALNGVAEEIPEHPEAALAMMRDLTAYLRHSLSGIDQPVVPVEAEVTSLRAYLRIQEARFGAKLRTRLSMDPEAALRPIANFLLQPLVENAVKYGSRDGHLEVAVFVKASGTTLRIAIVNTGTLEGQTTRRRGRGIGLTNVRRRLDVHYPKRHRFRLEEFPPNPRTGAPSRVVAALILEGEPC